MRQTDARYAQIALVAAVAADSAGRTGAGGCLVAAGLGAAEDRAHVENEHFRSGQGETTINDVTQLNPVKVKDVFVPTSAVELGEYLRTHEGPYCIGGGRFSMGGQTSSPDAILLDMRRMNAIVAIDPQEKTVTVQPGARWCDIQRAIDKHDLSIQVMQTYANFTVGGSLSVNCHGRYIGLGPLILSVKSLKLMLADGTEHTASRKRIPNFFTEWSAATELSVWSPKSLSNWPTMCP